MGWSKISPHLLICFNRPVFIGFHRRNCVVTNPWTVDFWGFSCRYIYNRPLDPMKLALDYLLKSFQLQGLQIGWYKPYIKTYLLGTVRSPCTLTNGVSNTLRSASVVPAHHWIWKVPGCPMKTGGILLPFPVQKHGRNYGLNGPSLLENCDFLIKIFHLRGQVA